MYSTPSSKNTRRYEKVRRVVAKTLRSLSYLETATNIGSRTKTVLNELDKLGYRTAFMPSIGPVKAKIIAKIIKKRKPKNILEIGALFGYSSIFMANLLPKEGKVISIEVSRQNLNLAKEAVKLSGLSDKIKFMNGDALEIIPKTKGKFDLVFIDALKEEYLDYLRLIEPKLRPNAIIIADNVGIFESDVKNYLAYVKNSEKYKSKTIETKLEFSNRPDALEVTECL